MTLWQQLLPLVAGLRTHISGHGATLSTGGFLIHHLDLECCPDGGGDLKISAVMLDAPVIERIFALLGL